MKTYYKVVNQVYNKLYSAIASSDPGLMGSIFNIEYKVNIWITPKMGKIFVFKELHQARGFLDSYSYNKQQKIYSVKVINPRKALKRADFNNFINIKNMKNFWNKKRAKRADCPIGTYFCDKIKLIKEIQ